MDGGDTEASAILPLTKVESDSGMRRVVAMKDRGSLLFHPVVPDGSPRVRLYKAPTSNFCDRIGGRDAVVGFEIVRWAVDEMSNPGPRVFPTGEAEVL
jgi:hypothetical protein